MEDSTCFQDKYSFKEEQIFFFIFIDSSVDSLASGDVTFLCYVETTAMVQIMAAASWSEVLESASRSNIPEMPETLWKCNDPVTGFI